MDDDFTRLIALEIRLATAPKVALPEIFLSEETDQPFCRCIDCDAELLLPGSEDSAAATETFEDGEIVQTVGDARYYLIQKTIVRNEAVFEFAICRDCHDRLISEFSVETRESLKQFTEEVVAGSRLAARLAGDPSASIDEWLAACMLCERPRVDCHRYSLSGLCVGGQAVVGVGPFVVCDQCEAQFGDLVSRKTRDRWDRFVEDHFDSPPWSEVDQPTGMPVLV